MSCLNVRDWPLSDSCDPNGRAMIKLARRAHLYNITGFPAQVGEQEGNASACVLELLRWRAGLLDYLSDVWDVMGEPALGLDECNAVTRFFEPIDAPSVCSFCLTHFEGDAIHPDNHECVVVGHVRAKWPPNPFDD